MNVDGNISYSTWKRQGWMFGRTRTEEGGRTVVIRQGCVSSFCPGGMAGIKGEILSALHFIHQTLKNDFDEYD